MIYSEKITAEQALMLQEKHSEILVFTGGGIPFELRDFYVTTHYNLGECLYLSRSDYATYIIGNKPVPEGYGYPSKELGSRIYDSLPYKFHIVNNKWNKGTFSSYGELVSTVELKWYEVAFPLTDLARVEAEAVVSEMERTEINAAQVIWMYKKKPKITHWQNDREWDCFSNEDLENSITDKYELLTSDYNSLPDEFKALAVTPSMPAHFADSTDWKAKYSELEREKNGVVSNYALLKQDYELYKADAEKQIKEARDVIRDNALSFADRFQEATASADSLQDRLTDAQNCIAVQEREITKLKNYIINQLIND